jgi:hypothetical protein
VEIQKSGRNYIINITGRLLGGVRDELVFVQDQEFEFEDYNMGIMDIIIAEDDRIHLTIRNRVNVHEVIDLTNRHERRTMNEQERQKEQDGKKKE